MIILFLLPLTFAIIFSIHTCFLSHPLREKGFPDSSDGKESICNAGELGSIPGSRRPPGELNGNPLQYSCLENSMDKGTWQAIDHGIAKSQT